MESAWALHRAWPEAEMIIYCRRRPQRHRPSDLSRSREDLWLDCRQKIHHLTFGYFIVVRLRDHLDFAGSTLGAKPT
jgi:hypothetical protein